MCSFNRYSARANRLGAFLVVALIGVLSFAYSERDLLFKAYVVLRIGSMHVFVSADSSRKAPTWFEELRFYWDIADVLEARTARLKRVEPELQPLVAMIGKSQRAGRDMALSLQIYREVRWRIDFTDDLATAEARISDLRQSLKQPEREKLAEKQLAADGSWGAGYTVWFLKLYGTVNDDLANGAQPIYPMTFLDRINSPTKLTAHLNTLLYDDFTKTGVINRQELDETVSALARLLCGQIHTNYPFDPNLRETFIRLLDTWQNPDTGCWGSCFLDRDGGIWRQDDVAMTFHIVVDRQGAVSHLDRIARRVLELDETNFPAGIRLNGHYENHLNMDVVRIFRYAWPQLDESTRRRAATEFRQMLEWCLNNSYQPDGTFKISELDDTPGDAMYYGISFLRELGFFDRRNRFWTNGQFPDAREIHERIKAKLEPLARSSAAFQRSWRLINDSP